METGNVAQKCAKPPRSKKSDYIIAIIINALMLIVVNQILNWGILPFLTQNFKQVIPIYTYTEHLAGGHRHLQRGLSVL